MDIILGINVNFKKGFSYFSNICCRYTLELPRGSNFNVFLQHMYFNKLMSCSP